MALEIDSTWQVPTADVREAISRRASLLGAFPEDADTKRWKRSEDLIVVEEMLSLFATMAAVRRSLMRSNTPESVKAAGTRAFRDRGIVEIAWENPRRRRLDGEQVRGSGKFALHAFCSPAAAEAMSDGAGDWAPGGMRRPVQVKHVVPAQFIVDMVRRALREEMASPDVLAMMYELNTHAIVTYDDTAPDGTLIRDQPWAGDLTSDAKQALAAHFFENEKLSDADLFATKWERYLSPARRDNAAGKMRWRIEEGTTAAEFRSSAAA